MATLWKKKNAVKTTKTLLKTTSKTKFKNKSIKIAQENGMCVIKNLIFGRCGNAVKENKRDKNATQNTIIYENFVKKK